MNFFSVVVAKTSQLKEIDDEKFTKKMKMITLKNWKLKRKKMSNVKLKEKVPRQSFQEQMIELQKMQLQAIEESEKRQQQFFEQMIDIQRKYGAAEKKKADSFSWN